MGQINLSMEDSLEETFRRAAANKFGLKKDFFQTIEKLRENETAFSPATHGS